MRHGCQSHEKNIDIIWLGDLHRESTELGDGYIGNCESMEMQARGTDSLSWRKDTFFKFQNNLDMQRVMVNGL